MALPRPSVCCVLGVLGHFAIGEIYFYQWAYRFIPLIKSNRFLFCSKEKIQYRIRVKYRLRQADKFGTHFLNSHRPSNLKSKFKTYSSHFLAWTVSVSCIKFKSRKRANLRQCTVDIQPSRLQRPDISIPGAVVFRVPFWSRRLSRQTNNFLNWSRISC